MRVLGIVPARGGSRRLAGKNMAVLGGKTLVRRALETALASRAFAALVLSSDDAAIRDEAHGLDGVTALERPAELATDTALTYDVVRHVLETLEAGGEPRFDAVAIVQCTSPFTAPEDISGAVAMLAESGAGSVVTVTEVESALHPLKLKRMEGDRLLPYLEDDRMRPSHDLPQLWVRNGSVYVATRATIEAGALVSDDVRGYRMPADRSHDIDTPRDLAFAEFLLRRREERSGPGASL